MTDQEINDAQRRDAEVFSKHMDQVDAFAERIARKIDKMYDGMDIFAYEDAQDTINMDGKFTATIIVRHDTGSTELEFSLRPHVKYVLPRLDGQTLRHCLRRMIALKF